MKSSERKRGARSVFDVHTPSEKGHSFFRGSNVLNLRQKFRTKHPWMWGVGMAVLALIVFWAIRQRSTHAEVQDFFPTVCLGDWQNPANAKGKPETMADASSSFSSENSAIGNGLGSQIFCGGFVPDNIATSSNVVSVGLTLVWQVGETPPMPQQPVVPSFAPIDSSSPTTTINEQSQAAPTSSVDVIDTTADTSTSEAAPVPTPEPTSTSEPASAPSSLLPFRSLFSRLVSLAFAEGSSTPNTDNTGSVVSAISADTTADTASSGDTTDTSTIILGPPLIANLVSTSTATDTGITADAVTDNTTSTDINASTSATSTAAMPAPAPVPDENFLKISYSTDGETWIDLAKVNNEDWPNFTVALPLLSWNDLQKVQIRAEEVPTTLAPVPPVYLDGMFMEVHYDVLALDTDASSTLMSSTTRSKIITYDPNAQQTCSVAPFSQTVTKGGSATAEITLAPSYFNAPYDVLLGDLPAGITATIDAPSGVGAATLPVEFTAAPTAPEGSFSAVIVYREREITGEILPNFCQFNLVVQ